MTPDPKDKAEPVQPKKLYRTEEVLRATGISR